MKSFKQYLSESDPNSWKPMPGYSYDGQDPNLRSDEEAEKSKEWYSGVQNTSPTALSRKSTDGTVSFSSSEVDASGRPTGTTIHTVTDSPEAKAKREAQREAGKKAYNDFMEKTKKSEKEYEEFHGEEVARIKLIPAWDKEREQIIKRQEAEAKARSLQAPLPSPLRTKNYVEEEPTETLPPRPWMPPMGELD